MQSDDEGAISALAPVAVATPTSRVGHRIRRARLNRNLTQGELAKGAFSVSYVSAVERGQIRPSLGALERLATRLQVPLSDLLTEQTDSDLEDSIALAESHSAEFEQGREEISARLREAQLLARQQRPDEAITVLKQVVAQATSPRDTAAANFYLAGCYMTKEQPDKARGALLEAMPIAERIGDRELLERSRAELGNVYELQGKHLLALECHRACYEAIQRNIMRDPLYKLNVLGSLGNEYWQLGEYDKAVEILKEAAELSNDVLNPERLGYIYSILSSSYNAQGDTARAKRYALHSIQSYEEVGNKRQAAYVHSRLGRAYLHADQLEEAEAHLRVANDMARKLDDPRGMSESARSLSELHLRRQEYDAAEDDARAALEAADRQKDSLQRADALLAMSEALEARGKRKEADAHVKQALTLLEKSGSLQHAATGYSRVSRLYKARNDPARALEMLERAWQTVAHQQS
ncbi:MAG TPA: tetratricopeptide repeat protein [Ktedonobacterales bacterium]|nr:tetratricopeptide repeat protein [Ktedonobacterales bacterium]